MRIVPAIDLKGGRCVRLLRGEWEQETVYSDDPLAMAWHWVNLGAEVLHVVDLDAAVQGREVNAKIIARMCREVPAIIEVGGGIRSVERAGALLAGGAGRVVFGTSALEQPHIVRAACGEFPGRVVVGIDAREGKVAVRGWVEQSTVEALALAQEVAAWGAARIVYTDIARDGTLAGLNLEATVALAAAVDIPVTASGGVGSLDDVRRLRSAAPPNLDEVIIGRALYSGAVDFSAAVQAGRE
ncbi:MAG: 1-(5-phosphoribosyl)-5-[(5-phosphoribosylamino)methylideneamino]imidazole-4-carboxamide isomerase [Candidatus Binatia bacterium]|nr:1-(5-phosphoribosyl)-5-[(5-phosphoribosylamino)methylideneamino]imidazole-4-carboxamide isomerase [Candidatus Binatia bacterium]